MNVRRRGKMRRRRRRKRDKTRTIRHLYMLPSYIIYW